MKTKTITRCHWFKSENNKIKPIDKFIIRAHNRKFSTKENRKRKNTFNSLGVIFNILEGSNSPFNRRRARIALFCQKKENISKSLSLQK